MKKQKKHSTKRGKKDELQPVQAEMETMTTGQSAEETNARIDRVFARLYRQRGNDLQGLADEVESAPESNQDCSSGYLFRVATARCCDSEEVAKDED